MSDIAETIQQPIEEAGKSNINSRVALFVALTATFMALCNVKDGNIVQSMSQAQAHGIDAWSYYQAKSTKQSIAENTLELLREQNNTGSAALIKKYEKEKAAIKTEAENYQKEYDAINLFDDQFDMTDALLTISIAMFGICSLTQKRWLLYFSSAVSLLGFILGLAAFLKISLHSDLISKILG